MTENARRPSVRLDEHPPDSGPAHLDHETTIGRVYLTVVQNTCSSVGTIARDVGLSETAVRAHLRDLEGRGLVARRAGDGGAWTAVPPAQAHQASVDQQQQALELARLRIGRLQGVFDDVRARGQATPAVRLLSGPEDTEECYITLQQKATSSVCELIPPPFFSFVSPPGLTAIIASQRAKIAMGVVFRTVYQRSALDDPSNVALIEKYSAVGEDVRALPLVPLKLLVVDGSEALVIAAGADGVAALAVDSAPFVRSLAGVFDTYWSSAQPIRPVEKPWTPRQVDVLRLLASGWSDDAIARELALSKRTLSRTLTDLYEALGARTRFQAGLKAAVLLPTLDA